MSNTPQHKLDGRYFQTPTTVKALNTRPVAINLFIKMNSQHIFYFSRNGVDGYLNETNRKKSLFFFFSTSHWISYLECMYTQNPAASISIYNNPIFTLRLLYFLTSSYFNIQIFVSYERGGWQTAR
jgi:hypothetical protein